MTKQEFEEKYNEHFESKSHKKARLRKQSYRARHSHPNDPDCEQEDGDVILLTEDDCHTHNNPDYEKPKEVCKTCNGTGILLDKLNGYSVICPCQDEPKEQGVCPELHCVSSMDNFLRRHKQMVEENGKPPAEAKEIAEINAYMNKYICITCPQKNPCNISECFSRNTLEQLISHRESEAVREFAGELLKKKEAIYIEGSFGYGTGREIEYVEADKIRELSGLSKEEGK